MIKSIFSYITATIIIKELPIKYIIVSQTLWGRAPTVATTVATTAATMATTIATARYSALPATAHRHRPPSCAAHHYYSARAGAMQHIHIAIYAI